MIEPWGTPQVMFQLVKVKPSGFCIGEKKNVLTTLDL